MSVFLDIVIVVDTLGLLRSVPAPSLDPDDPTLLPSDQRQGFCLALTRDGGGGSGRIDLTAPRGSSPLLVWRSLSLSGNGDQSAILYDVDPVGLGRPAAARLDTIIVPLPVLDGDAQTSPPSFTAVQTPSYVLVDPAPRRRQRHAVRFYVAAEAETEAPPPVLGYFEWAPVVCLSWTG